MDLNSYKTQFVKQGAADREWLVVDATDQPVGRLASRIARLLRGKHKPSFTPHVDCGDNVIVLNADKIRFTGKKWDDKEYVWYTGYPNGQRKVSPRTVMDKSSTRIVEYAIKGMLPKNRLGKKLFNHLYVYEGQEHPHEAQKPQEVKL